MGEGASLQADGAAGVDPLDPLSAKEITKAVEILRREHALGEALRFPMIALHEPSKEAVLAHRPGEAFTREAFIVVLDKAVGETFEAIVSLTEDRVRDWRAVTGVQPQLLLEEIFALDRIAKESPAFREALRRRGITDLDLVMVDPWGAGFWGVDAEEGRRLVRGAAYARSSPSDNGYAHPIQNVVVVVDLNAGEVVEVVDAGVVPVPEASGNYDAAAVGQFRQDLKPLEIRQPEGPSFEIRGHEVLWQRWRLHVHLHPREGLVLQRVCYHDRDRWRSILYRASLSEMVVPYADPGPWFYWRNAFDAGEYGMGKLIGSLQPGCDCLGEIRYLGAVFADDLGEPFTISNAICIHEEDYGILWKHDDFRSETSEVRRSRRLVISAIATVGNYEYGFYWYFYLDGTIQLEVKLTGILQTSALEPGQAPTHGAVVAPQLAAPYHEHLFNVRLDLDIDGQANRVHEVDARPVPQGRGNEHGNAFVAQETLLESEQRAQRRADWLAGRYWKIINPSILNGLGQPVGYKLIPAASPLLFADPQSSIHARAQFATRHLWVTPYRQAERYAAGDYPNQSRGGDGLPAWTTANRPLIDEDLVVWHTFGVCHIPRPEEWPVMPVEYTGFTLKPQGFFDRNPALDVPPSTDGHCHHDS